MPIFNKQWGCRLKELQNAKKFLPPNKAKDAAGLSSLIGFLNDNRITGAVVPKGEVVNASPVESVVAEVVRPAPAAATLDPTPKQVSTQQPIAAPKTPAPAANLTRIFLSGRFKTGKDFACTQAGFKILNAADPLYFLARYFFGDRPKDQVRTFLQTVGQIGRGTTSAEYSLTIERACFIEAVRKASKNWNKEVAVTLRVDWSSYGKNENIWLDSLVARAKSEPAGAKIAISGVRFQNEFSRLSAEGFVHFHCMASAASWSERLKKAGLTPESPACKDISEQLAASLDQSVTKQLSAQRQGPKLRCIWSDERVPAPSARLLTIAEFCGLFPK